MFNIFRNKQNHQEQQQQHIEEMKQAKQRAIKKEIEHIKASKMRVRQAVADGYKKLNKPIPAHYVAAWKAEDQKIEQEAIRRINKKPAFANIDA